MLYPLLHRLERLGHVESTGGTSPSGRPRKHYRLSAQRAAALAEQRRQWAVVGGALQQVWPAGAATAGRASHSGWAERWRPITLPPSRSRSPPWRDYVDRRDAIAPADVDELEDHLRDQVDGPAAPGSPTTRRSSSPSSASAASTSCRASSPASTPDRLWKQLVLDGRWPPDTPCLGGHVPSCSGDRHRGRPRARRRRGHRGEGDRSRSPAPKSSPATSPCSCCRSSPRTSRGGAGPRRGPSSASPCRSPSSALVLNLYPFDGGSSTVTVAMQSSLAVLATIGSLVALWLVTGIAVRRRRLAVATAPRMDFMRFTGEWLVYYVLIALGGGVLSGLTVGGVRVDRARRRCRSSGSGCCPAVPRAQCVVAAWLVEAKQSVIENIAPVLTKLFTPLFTVADARARRRLPSLSVEASSTSQSRPAHPHSTSCSSWSSRCCCTRSRRATRAPRPAGSTGCSCSWSPPRSSSTSSCSSR